MAWHDRLFQLGATLTSGNPVNEGVCVVKVNTLVHFEHLGRKLRGHVVGWSPVAEWYALRVTGTDMPDLRSTGYTQSDIIVIPRSAIKV